MDNDRVTVLSPEAYDAFLDALENPKPPGPALIALMRRQPPWPEQHDSHVWARLRRRVMQRWSKTLAYLGRH